MVRALQDQRLAWLANVPVTALTELLQNQENRLFRKELDEHTNVLAAATAGDLDRTVRNVVYAISSMVQKYQKTVMDIEAKYAPKYASVLTLGVGGGFVGLAAQFLPSLSALGPAAPLAAAAAVAGKYLHEKIHEGTERRLARRSLLGVLAATVPPQ